MRRAIRYQGQYVVVVTVVKERTYGDSGFPIPIREVAHYIYGPYSRGRAQWRMKVYRSLNPNAIVTTRKLVP